MKMTEKLNLFISFWFFAWSFRLYFKGENYVVRTDRSPPRGSTFVDRKSTIENDQIRTDSYYTVPYREIQTTKRQIKQGDMKYDGVGPVDDRGTPLGLKQVRILIHLNNFCFHEKGGRISPFFSLSLLARRGKGLSTSMVQNDV